MPRICSFFVVFTISTMLLAGSFLSAQKSESSCKTCPANQDAELRTIGFELPGVDFPFGCFKFQCDKTACGEGPCKNEIQIRCECEINEAPPFLSNLPYVNGLFKNVQVEEFKLCGCCQEECSQEDSDDCADGVCCGTAKCGDESKCTTSTCPESECSQSTGCSSSSCRGPVRVELTRYIDASQEGDDAPEHSELIDEMIELRIENERLKAQLEGAEHRMNMMREMFEVREANAELRAKIEFMEQHHAHTATSPHRPHAPASLRAPQQRVTFSSQPNQPRRIVAQPRQPSQPIHPLQQIHPPQPIHPPHGLIPPKQILPTVPATPAKPANYSIVKLPSAPGQTIATPNPKQVREIARLTQQLKELHQELKKAKKLNVDTKESGCNGTSCRGTKE